MGTFLEQVLDILQTHYPEHLGRAVIINLPFLINAFFKIITPFVDPITRPKMKFNPQVVPDGLFTANQCWKEFGGNCEFVYNHEIYWNSLLTLCNEKKKVQMKRWRQLGAKVGIKEWDVRRPLDEKAEGEIMHEETGLASEKTPSVQVAEVKESQESNEKIPVTTSVSEVPVAVAAC